LVPNNVIKVQHSLVCNCGVVRERHPGLDLAKLVNQSPSQSPAPIVAKALLLRPGHSAGAFSFFRGHAAVAPAVGSIGERRNRQATEA
jgi:hypothetical protein